MEQMHQQIQNQMQGFRQNLQNQMQQWHQPNYWYRRMDGSKESEVQVTPDDLTELFKGINITFSQQMELFHKFLESAAQQLEEQMTEAKQKVAECPSWTPSGSDDEGIYCQQGEDIYKCDETMEGRIYWECPKDLQSKINRTSERRLYGWNGYGQLNQQMEQMHQQIQNQMQSLGQNLHNQMQQWYQPNYWYRRMDTGSEKSNEESSLIV